LSFLLNGVCDDIHLTFFWSVIQIDLIYARLWQPTVPANLDLSDERTMQQIDESCVRTANGPRTATEILSLVPNIETFCMALKCIKLWAKRRAIYSNAMGYFGGVAWAILVARVCQLYPNGCPATIISRFFRIFFTWSWPSPVVLKYLVKGRDAWDSKVIVR
jgi:poly(A) polymerase